MNNPMSVWRLKVELLDVTPTVWRRFDTYADVKPSQLHYFIQGVMGNALIFVPGWAWLRQPDQQRVAVVRCLPRRRRTDTYTYDYGDNWQHRVTVEKTVAKPAGTYPRMVAGKYACPPEDCGGPWGYGDMGIWGYGDMLRELAGRRNAGRRELVEGWADRFRRR